VRKAQLVQRVTPAHKVFKEFKEFKESRAFKACRVPLDLQVP
jgi:hypothetical protein